MYYRIFFVPCQGGIFKCRVVFKSGKFVVSKSGMVFMRPRRPKLIQPGYFEGPAAAWAPRRDTSTSPFSGFARYTMAAAPYRGRMAPYLTTIAIYDAISIAEARLTGPLFPFRFC